MDITTIHPFLYFGRLFYDIPIPLSLFNAKRLVVKTYNTRFSCSKSNICYEAIINTAIKSIRNENPGSFPLFV